MMKVCFNLESLCQSVFVLIQFIKPIQVPTRIKNTDSQSSFQLVKSRLLLKLSFALKEKILFSM